LALPERAYCNWLKSISAFHVIDAFSCKIEYIFFCRYACLDPGKCGRAGVKPEDVRQVLIPTFECVHSRWIEVQAVTDEEEVQRFK
jgi:hypothetical protein